jgi:ornithine cyclodeaminase
MIVIALQQIKQQLGLEDQTNFQRIVESQERGFVALSKGEAVVPDVFHMLFDSPHPGDLHVKGAHLVGGDVYVIKIATGFWDNPKEFGIPTSQGLMIVGSATTGKPIALLQDDGYLTDLRTALAGLIAARYLAPRQISAIGVLGTGGQARLQAQYLKSHTTCRELHVWGRSPQRVDEYLRDMELCGFVVHRAATPADVGRYCNLIVTTTASREALLRAEDVRPGTHITAMGSDAPGKQELDPQLFSRAAIRAVDSKSQCVHHGESHYAIEQGIITADALVELGHLIADPALRRTEEDSITIADLTGVGVQDLQIAAEAAAHVLDGSR